LQNKLRPLELTERLIVHLLGMAALTVYLTVDYGELPAARAQSYGR